jgi:hypothetical protein
LRAAAFATTKETDWGSSTAFIEISTAADGSVPISSRPVSRSYFENVEVRLTPTIVLPIAKPPPPSERYSLMPVKTGAKKVVFVGGYDSLAKFFLCPFFPPEHVSRYTFFNQLILQLKNIYLTHFSPSWMYF